MKNDLRFCLVGRGSIGTRHIKNLKELSFHNIIAYSENRQRDKDKEYSEDYDIKTYSEWKDVRRFKPHVFILANPTSEHVRIAKMALELNGHIFMEKPLAHRLSDAEELERRLSERNVVFFLANNLHFHPALTTIKKLIDEGMFGEIYFARIMAGQYLPDWHPWEDYRNGYSARKQLGGGAILTLQHEIDTAYWLFGKFKRLQSFVKKISDLEINVEDIASIILETELGELVEVHVDYLQRPAKRSIHIQGSKGSVEYCFGDQWLRFYDFKRQEYQEVLNLSQYDNNRMYKEEMEHFIRCVIENEEPKIGIADAMYTLQVCLKVKMDFLS